MSILIKGMEMPTGERPVHIEIHRDGTVIQWKLYESDEIIGTAVEVPPHGRLINADLLGNILKDRAEAEWNKNVSPLSWSYAYECLMDILDDMPTVIEAEEQT